MNNKCACPKELTQQTDYSPGVVADDETILYVLLDPDHWQGGRLRNAAFSNSKLKQGSLSVSRARYSSESMLQECVIDPQIARNNDRRLVGVLKAICTDIRAITGDNPPCRVICVNDDGTREDPAHALLACSEPTKEPDFWDRNSRETVRASLILVFGGSPVSLPAAFAVT